MFLGDSASDSNKRKIFIPLTIDTRFWNKDLPNVFLNKVYEAQIEPEDKEIQYTTLQTYYTYAKDEGFQYFCDRLIGALGETLNQYHGLNESKRFWRAMLWWWIQEYAASIKFKIEQLKNLQKAYPQEKYTYCAYAKKLDNPYHFLSRKDVQYVEADEEYHFATYAWMAKNFFDFHIEKKDVQEAERNGYNKEIETKKGISSIYAIFCDAFLSLRKIALFSLKAIFPSRARVGLWHAASGSLGGIGWFLKSHGAIQEISIPIEQNDYIIDDLFRKSLPQILKDKTSASEEEQIILDFLPYALPSFFIENFKKQYNAASDYLSKHKNMVVIFTLTSMLESSAGKICELLLQKRGGKVIGQQHGGTYQVTTCEQEQARELEWNDIFYYWGKSALTYCIDEFSECKILYGPTYKFCARFAPILGGGTGVSSPTTGYFLFVGTALEAYPRVHTHGNVDGEKWEYIQRKIRFLSSLNGKARQKMIVREFPAEYGWHMTDTIKEKFPDVRLSTRESFNNVLCGCSLFIADVLATPWIEAIYFGKPVIFLLFSHEISIQNYKFRKEEKRYLDLLEEVGIIVHSPEEAAELVNHLTKSGVREWWMNESRQRAINLVKKRWTTTVDNIDDWWYHELMSQAENIKREN